MKVFGVSPVLCVANTDAALAFYQDVLGFTVDFQYPDYVGLRLGEAGIHVTTPSPGRSPGGSAVYVFCAEVDTYFGTIRGRGAVPELEPGDRIYAMHDFSIRDPDGNRLTFGCNLGDEDCAKD